MSVGRSAFLLALLASCSRAPDRLAPPPFPVPGPGEFSLMTYNLSRYNLSDRDDDGQPASPKSAAAREAVARIIAKVRPDVLAVQEIGNPTVVEEFRFALRSAGLDYPHMEYLHRGQSEINLAVFSRFPITDCQLHTDDRYSIGEAQIPVLRGFLDVEIEPAGGYRFRLIAAHLKSKVFHRLGQTEMRRNEARLLNKHVRRYLKEQPEANIAVVGDLNDTYRSAALREITGDGYEHLRDLRPRDSAGDVWTHFLEAADQYTRIDYILVSEGMAADLVAGKAAAIRDPETELASDHRPIVAVFRATPEDGSQRSEARGQRSEVGDQGSAGGP